MTAPPGAGTGERALELAEGLLSLPTAPFMEDLPVRFALELAEATEGVSSARDAAGNVLLRTGGEGPPLVLVAHLDHPGFRVDSVEADRATVAFLGGLAATAATAGSPVDLFRVGDATPVGRGHVTSAEGATRLTGATIEVTHGEAVPGGFAMWGFPGFELVDSRISGRVCDDLLGAAAALAALEAAVHLPVPVWVLLTRAEEIGLLGAFEAIRLGTVPRDAVVLSLECSKALPDAPQGGGVIVRVGDRRSIFDPGVSAALEAAATSAGVRHQRKLMDGGVCEASAFCAAGYRASGLALPLGNYHNASDDGDGVAAEDIGVDDYLAEVELLRVLAGTSLDLGFDGPWLAARTAEARAALGA